MNVNEKILFALDHLFHFSTFLPPCFAKLVEKLVAELVDINIENRYFIARVKMNLLDMLILDKNVIMSVTANFDNQANKLCK